MYRDTAFHINKLGGHNWLGNIEKKGSLYNFEQTLKNRAIFIKTALKFKIKILKD